MTPESLVNRDWQAVVARLGGATELAASAKATQAFRRARGFAHAVDLLRLVLAYCLGDGGFRLTTAWAASVGLADVSNVALLLRLRQCGDWLALLVGQVLAGSTPIAGQGRLIRVIDATMVPKAGRLAKTTNSLWRIHSAFDLPRERFGFFEVTDERGGERLDRIPVVPGEIRLADRAYLQPERMASILEAGADLVIRSGWKGARWLDAKGASFDLIAALGKADARGLIDRRVWIGRRKGALELRLVAVKKPRKVIEEARRKARQQARRGGHQISRKTLLAAEWVILVTSLKRADFSTSDILSLYRSRWRIELAFKRLKSLIGLKAPPGTDERSAKPYLMAHLLAILLLEPQIGAFEDSPHWDQAQAA